MDEPIKTNATNAPRPIIVATSATGFTFGKGIQNERTDHELSGKHTSKAGHDANR